VFGGEKFVNISACMTGSQDSAVSVETSYGYTVRDSNPSRRKRFSLLQTIQTGSRAHLSSYSMTKGGLSQE